jgi:hypothetical protein
MDQKKLDEKCKSIYSAPANVDMNRQNHRDHYFVHCPAIRVRRNGRASIPEPM